MDFTLSRQHELQQRLYRSFAQEEIKPLAHDMDEAEEYSRDLLKKMKKLGFFSIPFSAEYGGAGADTLSYVLCVEEVSKVDASSGVAISVHTSLCSSSINDFGNEEQKQKFLRPLLGGEKLGCFALTEPGAGSDVAAAVTTATLEGNEYVINGSKVFITNSGFSDIFIMFAVTDREKGAKGMSAFILEKEMPGLEVSANIPRMGIRAASNCVITCDGVRVPAENRLAKEGDGFRIAMKILDGGRIGIAAQALGIAQGALDEAVKYVKERKQFGKTISSFQNTQFTLAEMQTKIDAARLLVYRAAVAKDNKQPYSTYAAMAKLFASDVANEATRAAVQLFGGYGYAREYPVERMMRDAKITEIYEGTSEVMKMVIAAGMNVK
jgi:butyryl-CoA dehydrogenase